MRRARPQRRCTVRSARTSIRKPGIRWHAAAGPNDVIGNRIYAAWGVGDDGVLQILDRKKLLPTTHGGTWNGLNPDRPTEQDLLDPLAGILYMSPDQGGHTSFPIFGMKPASYQNFTEFKTRDIVLLASEATADLCQEAPHWSFVVDVTVENSKTAPPGTRVETNPWQGPMVLSTMSVDPRRGEKYARGNYCTRGARFGVHSSEENFRNPYYGRVTFLAYFTGGVRAWDIREPQAPVEVGFYVPVANANTTQPDGYMTNNVEVDNRGNIYATDRNGSGLDILQLRGRARSIGLGKDDGHPGHHHDDHDDHDARRPRTAMPAARPAPATRREAASRPPFSLWRGIGARSPASRRGKHRPAPGREPAHVRRPAGERRRSGRPGASP